MNDLTSCVAWELASRISEDFSEMSKLFPDLEFEEFRKGYEAYEESRMIRSLIAALPRAS